MNVRLLTRQVNKQFASLGVMPAHPEQEIKGGYIFDLKVPPEDLRDVGQKTILPCPFLKSDRYAEFCEFAGTCRGRVCVY